MSDFLEIFSSNKVEILFEKWKETLFGRPSNPFVKRFVIVPSPAMKSYLQLSLAKDPHCKIAAGLSIATIDSSLANISRLIFPEQFLSAEHFLPSTMELPWIVESTIRKLIATRGTWDSEQQEFWQPLIDYIHADVATSLKSEKRLISLSSHLADLFSLYGRYGLVMLKNFEGIASCQHWQQQLWKRIKIDYPALHFPYQLFENTSSEDIAPHFSNSVSIHLFAISFLPERIHNFFKKIAAKVPVNYYLLSPCQLFWSDLCSDREKRKLETFWLNKGASHAQIEQLELYLSNRNVLLANFGRMGREMAQQIEESAAIVSDCYLLSQSIVSYPQYKELLSPDVVLDPKKAPITILEATQADMALLRTQQSNQKIDFPKSENSIQMHVAPTKQREIEILYNMLVHIITTHSDDEDPILPGDIVVMAPDLCEYEAIVKAVFGAEESLIACQLSDVQIAANSSLVRGFMNLLKLATSRWEKEDVLVLFECFEFQQKAGLSALEVLEVREWVEASGIFWGKDVLHRQETFLRDFDQKNISDEYSCGTWDQGSNRLVMGFAVDPEGIAVEDFPFDFPSYTLEASNANLFEKWISLLQELKKQLTPISKSTIPLKEWSQYLFTLKSNFFKVEINDKKSINASVFLETQLLAIDSSEPSLALEKFSFDSIFEQFEKRLNEEKASFSEGDLHAVRFCSLLPMRALPAKVIVLIGLSEGAFPRQDIPSSLNIMRGKAECDYMPTQVDFDRYLFLEALLSARRYLLLSYSAFSSEEQRLVSPSLLVQELFSYLDDGYTVEGESVSLHCVTQHPFDGFHKSYFSKNGLISYSGRSHSMAKAYYAPEKLPGHQLIKEFSLENDCMPEESKVFIDIKDLAAFASNPIKTFLNKKHKIYIDKESEDRGEPFELTLLDKYQFRRDSVKAPFFQVLQKASKMGKMPSGEIFKAIATHALQADVDAMHDNFSSTGVDPSAIFSVTFSLQNETAYYLKEKGWRLPPLTLTLDSGKEISLIGTLKEVSSMGLIFHQERNIKGVAKVWPEFLALHAAIERHHLPIVPQMVSSKSQKALTAPSHDPELKLKAFIDYYFLGLENISPLIPEWLESLLKDDDSSFFRAMQNDIHGDFSAFYNSYALWLFKDAAELPSIEGVAPLWRKLAIDIYGELVTHLKAKQAKC